MKVPRIEERVWKLTRIRASKFELSGLGECVCVCAKYWSVHRNDWERAWKVLCVRMACVWQLARIGSVSGMNWKYVWQLEGIRSASGKGWACVRYRRGFATIFSFVGLSAFLMTQPCGFHCKEGANTKKGFYNMPEYPYALGESYFSVLVSCLSIMPENTYALGESCFPA